MGLFGKPTPRPEPPESLESLESIPSIGGYLEPAAVQQVLAEVDQCLTVASGRQLLSADEVVDMLLGIRYLVHHG